MATTQRITFTLTKVQLEWLAAQAERLGISKADLVRRIIDLQRERT